MKTRKPKFVLPRGTVLYLPDGVSLGDFFWNETPEEKCIAYHEQKRRSRLAKLHKLEVVWAAEDAERLHRRAAELAVVVEKDREYIVHRSVANFRLLGTYRTLAALTRRWIGVS